MLPEEMNQIHNEIQHKIEMKRMIPMQQPISPCITREGKEANEYRISKLLK